MTQIFLLCVIPIVAMGVTSVVAWILQKAMLRIEDTCSDRFEALFKRNQGILKVSDEDVNPPPAWIAAQTQLESYIGYNKFQSKVVFWAGLFVMLTGFWLTCFGILTSLGKGNSQWVQPSLSVGSGIITQLIGATFMLVYRTITQQTSGIITILDRTNLIGMTTCLIRSIPERNEVLRAETFANVAAIVAASASISRTDSQDFTAGRPADEGTALLGRNGPSSNITKP